MSSFYTLKRAKQRLAAGQPVYADFFSKKTGKQTRVRVVRVSRLMSGDFTLLDVNGETSERLTEDRVSFTNV